MKTSEQISKHLKDVHFGGNWTCVNLKDVLTDVTREEALTSIYDLNTIAVLVNHINYYVGLIIEVLRGGPLNGKDELSFTHPPIESEEDWQKILKKVWEEAETITGLISLLPDQQLHEDFYGSKYGSYYRNLSGLIEHTHYHLGQIVIIKKSSGQTIKTNTIADYAVL